MKRICAALFILLSVFFAGKACGFENKDNLITGITYIDRSTGESAWLYELSGIFSRDENTRYILGVEIRDDILSQRFARLGLIYTMPILKDKELSIEADYRPGQDSNNDPWHIFFLNGEVKFTGGMFLGASYKYFVQPGDDLGLASVRAGYYNKVVMLTGEYYDSLNSSPVEVSSFVMKGVFSMDRVSFLIGGSVGKTFINYAQLAEKISYETKEGFAGITYRLNDITFAIVGGRTYQKDLRQDYYTLSINYMF